MLMSQVIKKLINYLFYNCSAVAQCFLKPFPLLSFFLTAASMALTYHSLAKTVNYDRVRNYQDTIARCLPLIEEFAIR